MKILHLVSSSGLFGAEKVILSLSRALAQKDCLSYLICLQNRGKEEPALHLEANRLGLASEVFVCSHKLDIGVILRIKNFIQQQGIELINSHGYKANFYGVVASWLSRVPIVATLHGWTAGDNRLKLYEKLDRWLIRHIRQLVAVSPAIESRLRRLGLPESKITFIPNAVDVNEYDPEKAASSIREEYNIGTDLIVGAIGRLSPEKGYAYLLQAVQKVLSQEQRVRLLIVGEGPLARQLQAQSARLGINDKVIFAGTRGDILSVYKEIDIFVLPSLTEGIPLVLLEAMSMRLPVVASAVGGVPYILTNGSGMMVAPEDAEALKDKIIHLVNNPQLRKNMGEQARKRVIAAFSVEPFAQSYLRLYGRLSRPAQETAIIGD